MGAGQLLPDLPVAQPQASLHDRIAEVLRRLPEQCLRFPGLGGRPRAVPVGRRGQADHLRQLHLRVVGTHQLRPHVPLRHRHVGSSVV